MIAMINSMFNIIDAIFNPMFDYLCILFNINVKIPLKRGGDL
jgi:hypothetical protein